MIFLVGTRSMKRMCAMCGQIKDLKKDFKIKVYRNNSRKPFVNPYCNTCQKLYNKEYQRIYRERNKLWKTIKKN